MNTEGDGVLPNRQRFSDTKRGMSGIDRSFCVPGRFTPSLAASLPVTPKDAFAELEGARGAGAAGHEI